MPATHDWLQVILAEFRTRLSTFILSNNDLKLQWYPYRRWMDGADFTVAAIKGAIADLISEGRVRVLVWPEPSSYHLGVALEGRNAIEVINRPNRELRGDRSTCLELTQKGAVEWENGQKPDWEQYYHNDIILTLEDGNLHVQKVECLTRLRLEKLLENYCSHFGYADPPGLMHLTVRESTNWEATYWKKFDRYFEATFLAQYPPDEQCCTSAPSEDSGSNNAELHELFERWKLDG